MSATRDETGREARAVRPDSMAIEESRRQWPTFKSIPTPRVVGMFVGNGVGSKLLQSYLDGAPDLYMIPAYPLMYLYPHWQDWQRDYRHDWHWDRVIERFCEKHASVIDSRRIPGFNGMRNLGKNQDEYVAVDEHEFRETLKRLLDGEPVRSATFVLAVHYAYAMCRGEDIAKKRVLLYHVHARQYLGYFLADFPDARVVAMTRDPRSNIERRISAYYNVDAGKMNATDARLFRALPTYKTLKYILHDNQIIASAVAPERLRVVRHEDMGVRHEATLKALCDWIGLTYTPAMLRITFGGKEWWSDAVYDRPPMNTFNPDVLSKEWQEDKGGIEWFVQEGLMLDFLEKYGYDAERYTRDSFANRLLLVVLSLLPMRPELDLIGFYLKPRNVARFIADAVREARGSLPIKDYTWNATYLYKWTYLELRLWKARPHVRWLLAARAYRDRRDVPRLGAAVFALASAAYVGGQLVRYGYAVARLPYWFLKTRGVLFRRMRERWSGRAKLPDLLLELDRRA
jgi:Sulfotransferase family